MNQKEICEKCILYLGEPDPEDSCESWLEYGGYGVEIYDGRAIFYDGGMVSSKSVKNMKAVASLLRERGVDVEVFD